MKKAILPRDKYFLRDLHKEIDLYDRKLAYLDQNVDFANTADRDQAREKMLAKRAAVERTARELAALGVEFNQNELPRSFLA